MHIKINVRCEMNRQNIRTTAIAASFSFNRHTRKDYPNFTSPESDEEQVRKHKARKIT